MSSRPAALESLNPRMTAQLNTTSCLSMETSYSSVSESQTCVPPRSTSSAQQLRGHPPINIEPTIRSAPLSGAHKQKPMGDQARVCPMPRLKAATAHIKVEIKDILLWHASNGPIWVLIGPMTGHLWFVSPGMLRCAMRCQMINERLPCHDCICGQP